MLAKLLLCLICSDPALAVVAVGDVGSGVCFSPEGHILTVKHLDVGDTVEIRFYKGKSVLAHKVYVCSDPDGPMIFDCEGDGYPYLNISDSKPEVGDPVTCYGKNYTNNKLFKIDTVVIGGSIEYNEYGSIKVNKVKCTFIPGTSGGPVLNAKNEIVGLIRSTPSLPFSRVGGGIIAWGPIQYAAQQIKQAPKYDLKPIPIEESPSTNLEPVTDNPAKDSQLPPKEEAPSSKDIEIPNSNNSNTSPLDKVADGINYLPWIYYVLIGSGVIAGTGGFGAICWFALSSLSRLIKNRKKLSPETIEPTIITTQQKPPPQMVLKETEYVPLQRNDFAEAYAYAKKEMVNKYPGAVDVFETADSLIKQFLSAKGIKA